MVHKAWSGVEEVPNYCMSTVKFLGQKIDNFDPKLSISGL